MRERYEILRELGSGGMGAVYLARDLVLDREVALKVLKCQAGLAAVDRLVKEARATASLDHPAFLPIYTIERDGPSVYFTMEPVRGRTLAEALEDRVAPIARDDAVRALAEVGRGLAYAHERGLVHRDLKPSNVMLGADGSVRILDWGLVRFDRAPDDPEVDLEALREVSSVRITVPGAIVGTPAYLSPEQALGDASRIGPATDVHALGSILYEILTGSPPRIGNLNQILYQLVNEDLEPASVRAPDREVPKELEAIASRAMARDPQERYPSAEALVADLEAWLRGDPVRALPLPLPARAGRWIARHRRVTASILGAAFLLSLGALGVEHAQRTGARRREDRERIEAESRRSELEADLAVARAALAEAREARRIWRGEYDGWRSARAAEDRVLASVPALPAMAPGESLESFERRTRQVQREFDWRRLEGVLASRGGEPDDPGADGASTARRTRVLAALDRFRLASQSADRFFRRARLAGGEAADRDGPIEIAALALEVALAEALAVEADAIGPAALREARRTALWESRPDDLPAAWREVVAALRSVEAATGRPEERARALLAGRTPVRLGPAPPGTRIELREDGAAPRPVQGGEVLDLPPGEYVLALARGDVAVLRPFVVERGIDVVLALDVPAELPEGTVLVAAGSVVAGGDGVNGWPRHRAGVERSFAIGRTEVTLADYARFLAACDDALFEACRPLLRSETSTFPILERSDDGSIRLVAEGVDWADAASGVSYVAAAAYARWRTSEDPAGRLWRLPTALEWTLAAGGPAGRAYPWGEGFDPDRVRCEETRQEGYAGRADALPGGASPFGALQMSGNVWEWTATPDTEKWVALLGGAWGMNFAGVRVSSRVAYPPRVSSAATGFRLVCVLR